MDKDMDPYVSAVLVGIETRAWAQDRVLRAQQDADEVACVVEAEWATVTLVDRLLAARGYRIELTCLDGTVLRGLCTDVGADWLSIRSHTHDALHITQIAYVADVPSALHHEDVRRMTWTSFLRSLVGRWIRVRALHGDVSGRLQSVARDHITLDDGSLIAVQAILRVRLAE